MTSCQITLLLASLAYAGRGQQIQRPKQPLQRILVAGGKKSFEASSGDISIPLKALVQTFFAFNSAAAVKPLHPGARASSCSSLRAVSCHRCSSVWRASGRCVPVMSTVPDDTAVSEGPSHAKEPIFQNAGINTDLKLQMFSLAANLDRGQSYNPTSSDAYKERMEIASGLVRALIARSPPLPTSLDEVDGEWELLFTDVEHGIFRSSPFFLAIQQAFMNADPPEPEQAALFFKLHELQTCSWGVSKIGRVAQTISASEGMLYSEFDTNLLSLTVIPILGWFKLLPTFGGSIVTASSANLVQDRIEMEVKYTTSRPVPGLSGPRPLPGEIGFKIRDFISRQKVPVGAIWKLLPWNKGRGPECAVKLVYFDGDMRIVQDPSGDFFVYTRPVAPRPFPSDG